MKSTVLYLAVFALTAAAPAAGAPKRPAFVLPETVYAAPGVECSVYFDEVLDSVRPDAYAFEACAKVGRCEARRWTWTPKPADAGKCETVVLNAWSDAGLACACTTTVRVAKLPSAEQSRRITCAILGDSLTNSRYQDRVRETVRSAGWKGFDTVGSRGGHSAAKAGDSPDAAPHDGYGGYTPGAFLTRYAMTVDEIDNLQSEEERSQLKGLGVKIPAGQEWRKALLKSPLVRMKDGNKTVDVQAWLDKVNGGAAPDFLLILLGVNGTCAQRDESVDDYCENGQVAPMRDLVKALRGAAPKTKIAIGTCAFGSEQDAFGKGYGCSISLVQCRKNMLNLNRRWAALVEEFNKAGDPNVFLVPVGSALDSINGYPRVKREAFAGSSIKTERSGNAVHPSLEGGKQLGDAFASWILCNL